MFGMVYGTIEDGIEVAQIRWLIRCSRHVLLRDSLPSADYSSPSSSLSSSLRERRHTWFAVPTGHKDDEMEG